MSSSDLYFSSSDLGESVENVSDFIKKHEAFEKLLVSQEERLQALQSSGSKLLEQNHFDSETIRRRMNEVTERRKHVAQGSRLRRDKLQDSLLLARFRQSAAEAEAWIDERAILLKAASTADVLLRIQKHPALQAELAAHKKNVTKIMSTGEELLTRKHVPSQLVRSLIQHLSSKLEKYEHTLDAYMFQNEADLLEGWIESKVQVLKAENLGESVEEIEQLLKQHEEFERIISAHEEKFSSLSRTTLLEKKIQDQEEEEKRRKEAARNEEERRRASGLSQSKSIDEGSGFGFVRSLMGSKGGKGAKSKQSELAPILIEGFLERKHEHQSGGKRSGFRSWKAYYTVLCGQTLCFFRDKQSIHETLFVAAPISVLRAKCSRASDYTKKKHVFRLQLEDESEYLFASQDESSLQEWMEQIEHEASLPPSAQHISTIPVSELDGRPEISAPINGSFVVGSVDSKRREAPPPPPSEQSENGRPPAPLPSEQSSNHRGRPPLPPPRSTPDVMSKSQSGHLEEDVRLRNGSNGGSRSSSHRRSVPAATAGNGDPGIDSTIVDHFEARSNEVSTFDPSHQIPLHVPASVAPVSQVRVASTRLITTHHPSLPRSQNNIVLDDSEWPNHVHPPNAFASVDPHLNPTLFPAQNVPSHHEPGDKMPRPPSASSAEEELAAMNQKTKKKGMMSLFKRNK